MNDPSNARRSSALRTLQAVRLAGVGDTEALADRALLTEEDLWSTLADASARGLVERGGFADLQGWIITARGQTELASMLAAEVNSSGAGPILGATLDRFEVVNARFVDVISAWQLRSPAVEQPGDAADIAALLRTLAELGDRLTESLAELVPLLRRFGRYPAQYRLALRRADSEGERWISGLGIPSCHVVWAELHQDLLSTAGRARDGSGGRT